MVLLSVAKEIGLLIKKILYSIVSAKVGEISALNMHNLQAFLIAEHFRHSPSAFPFA